MSASKLGILRRCVHSVRHVLGFATVDVTTNTVTPTFADIAFAEIDLAADNSLAFAPFMTAFPSVADLAAILSGSSPRIASSNNVDASEEHAHKTRANRKPSRPLAAQLAITAARNVRKGRKSRSFIAPRARVLKAKPTAKPVVKKRAPKRRHVWLSNQSRVIRPVTTNVVSMTRPTRVPTRPATPKAPARFLRLAA
jgi:hypothetical protein